MPTASENTGLSDNDNADGGGGGDDDDADDEGAAEGVSESTLAFRIAEASE
jgi:hypothetical protein